MNPFDSTLFWVLLFVGGSVVLSYHRINLFVSSITLFLGFILYILYGSGSWLLGLSLGIIIAALLLLNNRSLRSQFLSKPVFTLFKTLLPDMSSTEREALEAGSVWWEGELFSGKPNWKKLMQTPPPALSAEEQAFLSGPVETLCKMLDTWKLNHEYGDLTDDIYSFIHKNKFLGMIIPKEYNGLGFSVSAQIAVLTKICAVNTIAANYISVPNSLGPAELLLKYGTEAQKSHYLPRLANGREIPCFGLTAPRAGSDATSLPDTGIICRAQYDGKEVIGIRLNFEKRYITLAPIATLIGLGFKLYDPDSIIGDKKEYGITCALIPRNTPGLEIGRRHFPIGAPFINGPIKGKDVFVPLDFIIGGPEMAGKGWRMLVERLAVGRAISLPSASLANAKTVLAASSAYARIRKQFNTHIGKFEAIQGVLARMAGRTYIMEAAIRNTGSAIDSGEEPAIPSAILKYHCTELCRSIVNDAMDIHGGKGAVKGPRNYLSFHYETTPVAITVEGANILTRSLIIFGQGAVRCHPYVLQEMEALQNDDEIQGMEHFDKALFGHIGFTLSNACRAFIMGITRAKFTRVPTSGAPTRRYYQQINRYSAAFALAADMCMLTLGGSLKFREMLSSRLGDILSMLYLTSLTLKHYENQHRPEADLPLVDWSCRELLYQLQEQLHLLLRNLPNRPIAVLLRCLIFPLGRSFSAPADSLSHDIAGLLLSNTDARSRLLQGAYLTPHENNPVGRLNALLAQAESIAPLERKLTHAVKQGLVIDLPGPEQIDDAENKGILNKDEAHQLRIYDSRVMEFIHVDDFAYGEIGTNPLRTEAPIRMDSSNNVTEISFGKK